MKKENIKRVIAVTLMISMLTACGAKPATPPAASQPAASAPPASQPASVPSQPAEPSKAPEVDNTGAPEELPPVQVSMPEYELTYSGNLKDAIIYEELKDGKIGLKFDVKLSESQATIFELYYNTTEGDLVTVLNDKEGNKVPVAFAMSSIPEGLNEKDELLFYSAQEAVNEIVSSLVLK